jgi:hypothetical protein
MVKMKKGTAIIEIAESEVAAMKKDGWTVIKEKGAK